jgi:enediyne biosynthesis protein E4
MLKLVNAALTLVLAALSGACSGPRAPDSSGGPAAQLIAFTDQAGAAGLTVTHANGMTGEYLEAEIYAPGVALFDFDNDGDLDVYVVAGRLAGTSPGASGDRLFRNDLTVAADGRRILRFTDVTAGAGIAVTTYGMGVAAGDFNNDGWTDLYTTRLDANVLLRNNGNGTFSDVTAASGTADARTWSVSAAFVDIDRDGWLDLFVTNYLDYDVHADIKCFSPAGAPDYCDPSSYRPAHDRLYRNQRNGTFVDVTARALPGGSHGAGLGIATADFNGDGRVDIYVANDRRENDLWTNQGDGTFRNTALGAGVALNADGRAEGSMGVDAGDFDNDGDEDLFVANFTSEGHTLYVNHGDGTFDDAGVGSGIRPASLPYTGFGTAWIDADNDGWLDLLTVNGAVQTIEALSRAGDPFPLRQGKQLFRNRGDGRFEPAAGTAVPALAVPDVSRGAAFGDVDNDGDIDAVIGNNNGPLRLLINGAPRRHWLGLRLTRPAAQSSDAVNARVAVTTAAGRTLWRRARADGSYASANDPRVLIGLADVADPVVIRVIWPDGRDERWENVTVDRWMTLREGTGR